MKQIRQIRGLQCPQLFFFHQLIEIDVMECRR